MAVAFPRAGSAVVRADSLISAAEVPTDSTSEEPPSATSVVNLLFLGKVGVGKARMINGIFQNHLFETGATTSVIHGVSQRENEFIDSGILFRVKIFDTYKVNHLSCRISISKTMSTLRQYVTDLYPSGINMVFLVYRNEDCSNNELKKLKYILRRLNEDEVSLISALIINGCADKSEKIRRKIVTAFDEDRHTQLIGRYVLQGMYTVGFTDLSTIPDALADMYQSINHRDAALLRKAVEKCYSRQLTNSVFFSQGGCRRCLFTFPWHYCPCYNQIYKCWRWGYTWDDCMNSQDAIN